MPAVLVHLLRRPGFRDKPELVDRVRSTIVASEEPPCGTS